MAKRTDDNQQTDALRLRAAYGRRPSRLLDLLPIRLMREAFRAYPTAFTGLKDAALRRRAHGRLRLAAERFAGSAFGAQCAEVLRQDVADVGRDPNAWIGRVLDLVARTLEAHPFSADSWDVRAEALKLLDYPLHVRDGHEWRRQVGRFYQRFMTRALAEMAEPVPDGELRVWKMYNMGFVAKTRGACVGFDIHPGVRLRPRLTWQQVRRLAALLDVALVSHPHWDHESPGFLRRMLMAGKAVVLPDQTSPRGDLSRAVRSRSAVGGGLTVGPVGVRAYPGWQRFFVRNFVHVVEMDGFRVAHTGDNTHVGVYEALCRAPRLDLALVNGWAGFRVLVRRARPRMVLVGHENELGHLVSMRFDYGYTFQELSHLRLGPPARGPSDPHNTSCAVMSWGERLTMARDGPAGRVP
jgi:hypothetical protein